MTHPTFAERWRSFNADVVPPEAGPEQRTDLEIAFYYGAHAAAKALGQTTNLFPALIEPMEGFLSTVGPMTAFQRLQMGGAYIAGATVLKHYPSHIRDRAITEVDAFLAKWRAECQ